MMHICWTLCHPITVTWCDSASYHTCFVLQLESYEESQAVAEAELNKDQRMVQDVAWTADRLGKEVMDLKAQVRAHALLLCCGQWGGRVDRDGCWVQPNGLCWALVDSRTQTCKVVSIDLSYLGHELKCGIVAHSQC